MAELAKALLREMRADNELVTDIRDSQKNFHLALFYLMSLHRNTSRIITNVHAIYFDP
ncbi:hypothetical protein MPTK1_2g16970 [Marchantia polymorpha subsp. ruderalis]|uniref:Uncharacterized protein n=1 Tax=Marchantia polymorpha TaxID=3197 RepID=A0A2R6WCM8_MARPO|nr:hypothetical protein MARPO_0109s0038 [Marchantia polymorpha]BBN02650.1 hypothetical protein Mp_2g16970 [Marchantia polymorpha subsp. ruderalis]|eukprot:PTQ31608.1 hypothetical protein MARPO_0109s0038 [Marchantia polymorpha]